MMYADSDMYSSAEPDHWSATGFPACNDFRARDCAHTARKTRHQRSYRCRNNDLCRCCEAIGRQRQHRNDCKTTAAALDDGRELSGWSHNDLVYSERDEWGCSGPNVEDVDFTTFELWRLGILYEYENERGSGFSLNAIPHDENDFLIAYKSPRTSRRSPKELGERSLSPVSSFEYITSDEELAAFLSVYDFVDVDATDSISEDEEGLYMS